MIQTESDLLILKTCNARLLKLFFFWGSWRCEFSFSVHRSQIEIHAHAIYEYMCLGEALYLLQKRIYQKWDFNIFLITQSILLKVQRGGTSQIHRVYTVKSSPLERRGKLGGHRINITRNTQTILSWNLDKELLLFSIMALWVHRLSSCYLQWFEC